MVPLTEAVQGLCETSCHEHGIDVSVKLMNSPQPVRLPGPGQYSARCIVNDDSLHDMLRYTDWGILLSSCLEKVNKQGWSRKLKEDFVYISARSCLSKSTVNCILPQSRGFTMKQDERLFTINSLEQLLVKSKLR